MAVTAPIVASLVIAEYSAEKQEEFQEKQAGIERSNKATQRFAKRRRALREARIKRAQLQQSAENTGVGGSSGEAAGIANLATGQAVNEQMFRTEERLGAEFFSAARDYQKGIRNANIASTLVQAGASAYNTQQNRNKIGKLEDQMLRMEFDALSDENDIFKMKG